MFRQAGIPQFQLSPFQYAPIPSFCSYHRLTEPRSPRGLPPLDLSKATKLKYVGFRWAKQEIRWIIATLETARSNALQQITIHFHFIHPSPSEETSRDWHTLDSLLIRLWTSRSIFPKVSYRVDAERLAPRLLPELKKRDLVWPL
jgi:hypothetical protein